MMPLSLLLRNISFPNRRPQLTICRGCVMQEALDSAFIERQARTTGVCSVREELYSQTFGAWGCMTHSHPAPPRSAHDQAKTY